MSRRQAARVQEEAIPEDLIANIPVVGGNGRSNGEATTFAIEHEEVIYAPPPPSVPGEPDASAAEEPIALGAPASDEAAPPLSQGAAIAAQLRYDLGEAFARELDKAEQAVSAAVAEMESRLAAAEAQMAALRAEAERERTARETAEARLKAFKELALR